MATAAAPTVPYTLAAATVYAAPAILIRKKSIPPVTTPFLQLILSHRFLVPGINGKNVVIELSLIMN